MDITGIANPTAAVTVNGSNAVRQGEYFWQPVTVGNTNAAQYVTNIVASTYGSGQSATGAVFIARTPEAFSYDADGNLTSDGRWTYTWDGENRLASMTANTSAGPQQQLVFQYDWQGRRIAKQVSVNVGGGWSPISDQRFVYDGWNLLAVLDGSLLLQTSFVWGLDLSGSMQGAGGVGGLLFLDNCESPIGSHAATYDGNGNVAALVSAADCSVSARYEYGPFGELIRSSGPARGTNPFRFSTKYQEDETDLLYYGYRFYNAAVGRWISRDPFGDDAFRSWQTQDDPAAQDNLRSESLKPAYHFLSNDDIDHFDKTGLEADVSWHPPPSSCAKGQSITFIQVAYGGWGPYKAPFVDDGSAGYGASGTGCPEYPNFGNPGSFQDSPGGVTGTVKFITCLVCTKPCCSRRGPGTELVLTCNDTRYIV